MAACPSSPTRTGLDQRLYDLVEIRDAIAEQREVLPPLAAVADTAAAVRRAGLAIDPEQRIRKKRNDRECSWLRPHCLGRMHLFRYLGYEDAAAKQM